MTPVLLDTDPGSDIDDVIAIAYLLAQPRCELLGISTVTGDVGRRAALAEIVCLAAGRNDVPIVAGKRDVIAYGPGQPDVPHYESVAGTPHREYPEDEAVGFLRNRIRSRPGEITLLTIGPLTNIGLLFALDPEIPSLLKEIVSMGGSFFEPGRAEWNCRCDPVATAMVARAKRPKHTWVGLDVTMHVREDSASIRKAYRRDSLKALLPMIEFWLRDREEIIYHDPLAAACLFEPTLCAFEAGTVTVDASNGRTHFRPGRGTDWVAASVEPATFFEHFFEVLS